MPSPRPHVAQLVNQASRLFASIGDARLKELGFRYAQVPVLASLRDGATRTQAELIRELGVEQSSMAQLLARMERDGIIERTPHAENARITEITATKPTAKRLPAARAALHDLDAEATKGLTAAEQATLAALLGRVLDNLRRIES